jgi:hypothetical protein
MTLLLESSIKCKINYNIPGFQITKREATDMCIAFMHEKLGNIRRSISTIEFRKRK